MQNFTMKQYTLYNKLMYLLAACAFMLLPTIMASCGGGNSDNNAR